MAESISCYTHEVSDRFVYDVASSDGSHSYIRKIPIIIKLWILVASFYFLGFQNHLYLLSGIRIGHVFYYFEVLLLPSLLILLFRGFKKVPILLIILGVWLLLMGIVGYLKGHSPSYVYDRTRNWGVFVFLALLFNYKISSIELLKIIKPVFFCAWIGNVLTIFAFSSWGIDNVPKNTVSMNWLGGLYYLLLFMLTYRPLLLLGPMISLAYVFFAMLRGSLIAMCAGVAFLFMRYISRLKFSVIIIAIGFIFVFFIVYYWAPVSKTFDYKDIREIGIGSSNLQSTFQARLNEVIILKENLHGLQWLHGLGTGATWSGTGFYEEVVGTQRFTFHIYYAQIIYYYGIIGLLLFTLFLILPVIKAVFFFFNYGILGQACIIFMISLLISWMSTASDNWSEVFVYCVAIYGMYIDKQQEQVDL